MKYYYKFRPNLNNNILPEAVEDYTILNLEDIPIRTISQNKFNHLTVELAYQVYSENFKQLCDEFNVKYLIGTDWEILCDASQNDTTSKYSYRAIAFINNQNKQIHIASAGTVLPDINDLRDNKLLIADKTPLKLTSAQNFFYVIAEKIGGVINLENYLFTTSGHSLGAVVADLTLAYIMGLGYQVGKSYTYDNPGSLPIIMRAIEDGYIEPISITELQNYHFHTQLTTKNLINILNPQLGQVHLVLANNSNYQIDENNTSFGNFLSKLKGLLPITLDLPVWAKHIYSHVSDIKGIKHHSLSTFSINDDVMQNILKIEYWDAHQPIIHASEWDKFKQLDSTGNDLTFINIVEVEHPRVTIINKNNFAYRDIIVALNGNQTEDDA